MGDLLIRNIPEGWKAEMKRLAAENKTSLSETAREALRAGLDAVSKRSKEKHDMPPGDRLRAILGNAFETQEEFEEFQRALEDIRHAPDRLPPRFE